MSQENDYIQVEIFLEESVWEFSNVQFNGSGFTSDASVLTNPVYIFYISVSLVCRLYLSESWQPIAIIIFFSRLHISVFSSALLRSLGKISIAVRQNKSCNRSIDYHDWNGNLSWFPWENNIIQQYCSAEVKFPEN